eukprot:m.37722 g.37722  ORF g.37722 m.37722 type:complete len:466 (+) comp10148_c0_seq1:30-1427(+)
MDDSESGRAGRCDVAVDTTDLDEFVQQQTFLSVKPHDFLKREQVEGSFLKAMLVPVIYPMIVQNSFKGVPRFQKLCGVIPPRDEKLEDEEKRKVNKVISVRREGIASEGEDSDHEDGDYDDVKEEDGEVVDYGEWWQDPSKPVHLRAYNFLLSFLFKLGAWSGSEGFYISFLPALFWCGSAALARRCIMYWMLSMYIGQYMKEHFQLPRPFVVSKKVRALGTSRWLAEYGFPSTHVMASVGLGSVLFHYLLKYSKPEELPVPVGYIVAYLIFMAVITSAGRVYLGVHSTPDLVGGLVFHIILFGLYLGVEGSLDRFITSNPSSTWGSALFSITLLLAFPRLKKWSETFGDTAVIVGAGNGVAMAQYAYSDVYTPLPFTTENWNVWLWYSIGRTVIGLCVLFLVRLVVKTITMTFMLIVCGGSTGTPVNRRVEILIPTKLVTYSAVGYSACVFAPMLFDIIGLTYS